MTSNARISKFTLCNASGESVLYSDFSGNLECKYRGPTIKHYWYVSSNRHERPNPRADGLNVLPDESGLLLCERVDRPNNLVLLDAYGQERMRLSIPWQLTRDPHPESAAYPSRFIGLTTPWDNPKTGEPGRFAVLAWVEYAGDYAFELDWHTGQFLWGYYLERG